MLKRLFILLPVFLFSAGLHAQFSSGRIKKFSASSDTLKLDSLSLVPGSLSLKLKNGQVLDSTFYKVLPAKKVVVLNRKKMLSFGIQRDSMQVKYKVFPFDFEKETFHKDVSKLQKDLSLGQNPFTINYTNSSSTYNPSAFQNDGLSKNGSVSRGISFGNNQDVVVNSNMNLQVSGKLTRDIDLVLAATDNNIPVQPDGNTQQLQEFDKVYIQLNDKSSKLLVGDFQISRPNSYFMNFYKRTQGLYFTNNYQTDPGKEKSPLLKTSVSGAVSRGRFARNVIQGVENNQGPYRLHGADNELFIIVLSGTEKIYIDGRLLTRGQENDYVIDYNTSEITFTAKQLITKDRRIEAEFQYAERNYARSLYFVGEEFQSENLRLSFNYYSEQDNKNKTLQQSLTNSEKLKLTQIGDTLSSAVTNGASITEFNTTEVFYRKLDSVTASGTYTIYLYSTAPDTAYRVRFSYVGEGSGNYKQVQSSANGKVYQWFEPLGGIRQGNYEPVTLLVTPKKKQMLTAGGEYKFNSSQSLLFEAAYTNNDLNTFSTIDTRDDEAGGGKINYFGKSRLNRRADSSARISSPLLFTYGTGYEFVQKNFTQIERFRSVEFTRDWNRKNDSIKNDQHIISASAGIEKGNLFKSNYTVNGFVEGEQYTGHRHLLTNALNTKTTRAFYNASYLQTGTSFNQTGFYRHKSKVAQQVKQLVFTYLDEYENNRFNYKSRDSLLSNSYSFWEWEGNISNADTTGNRFKVFYRERTDNRAAKNTLKRAAYAQSVGFFTDINSIKNHPIRATFTYRKLNIIDSTLIFNKPDNTLLSRIEYSPKLWKGFVQSNVFYEIGYGLEQKREYSYIQVAAGQGQYTWKDYNGNDIKELNEFEIAQYSDQAIYIRVFTPTNTYIKAGHDQFSGSLFLRPAVFKKESSNGFTKFMARFVSQTAYRLDKKTTNTSNFSFNPFDLRVNDSLLLSTNYSFRQALFFNQNSSVAGFDYTFQNNKSKQLLTNGFESRELQTHELRLRWNLTKAWGLFANNTLGQKTATSQFFSTRNYVIAYLETEPRLSFQPNTAFRISAVYKHSDKRNVLEGGFQKAILDDYAVELKFNKLSKGSFNMRSDFIIITYNDNVNTPLAFEMLNALKPGQNLTWNIGYQQNITSNMQISITYDGRKTPGNKVVHIGGAQVRAFF
ncbi:MAG: hypothetical protein ACJ76F_14030 [Bacteroidia bacterium]